MTTGQEEALYDFLDNATKPFELGDIVSHIKKVESKHSIRLEMEVEAHINLRNLAFPAGTKRWVSRRACFEPLIFVISPSRLELANGILIPGHRCIPFANSNLLPQEYTFFWQGKAIPFTTTEGPPEDFYLFYSIFGEEYAPQYVARDNSENEKAFNSDPYDDPPEVSIQTLDMRNIYREISFVPGDRFVVRTMDWKAGIFELNKVDKNVWSKEDLDSWHEAAESGFQESFNNLGPASCTEEQVAYAYWYGGSRMRTIPAHSLEDFLYEKTEKIETAAYGIETRFWFAGREIPDRKDLDTSYTHPDKTPIEEILHKLKIPVSEYVVQSYIRDFLYRNQAPGPVAIARPFQYALATPPDEDTPEKGKEAELITIRLIPAGVEIYSRDRKFIADYIENVLEEFREFYSPFSDKDKGLIRQRAGELHTAVIDLAARLARGDIDTSWLPRHTFIILSQIQCHTASVMEDLDSDEALPEEELEALDTSLDSMIETYEDIKELIEEAMDSFRRNKLAVIRVGSNSNAVTERLIQLSIGGIDVWRRLIVPENCTLAELHQIIQIVFGWRNSQSFNFFAGTIPGENGKTGDKKLDATIRIKELEDDNIIELLYEYGTKWTVRVIFLSRYESPVSKPVRCIAGAGAAPPEFIGGPVKLKRILYALESGNDMERLSARQELGPEFNPGEFDLDACNRNLNTSFLIKG